MYLTGPIPRASTAPGIARDGPDRFAAIGPSAGWIQRDTYGGRRGGGNGGSPIQRLMERGTNPGRTLDLVQNLKGQAVYILHGELDDNVGIGQAQRMSQVLSRFHHDWEFRVVPGQKHWYGNEYSDDGLACVDGRIVRRICAARPAAQEAHASEFRDADPGVSSTCHWMGIEAQMQQLDFSSATLHVWPVHNELKGRTSNVAVLSLELGTVMTSNTAAIELDGQKLKRVAIPEKDGTVWLEIRDGHWKTCERPGPNLKNPNRYGTIKDELKHRFLFVYGTKGSAEENAWALAKARFDAETFWTVGNGSIDMVSDTAFDPARYPDRAVVLYGNRDTNSAWATRIAAVPAMAAGPGADRQRSYRGDGLSLGVRSAARRQCRGGAIGVGARGRPAALAVQRGVCGRSAGSRISS